MTCSDFPVVDPLNVKIVSPWRLIFPLVGFRELSLYYRVQLANHVEKFIAMNTCKSLFSPDQEAMLRAYDRWHRALDDCSLLMDYPDAYHHELLRQADEMDRIGIVTWQEWRELRIKADQASCVLSLARITTDDARISQSHRWPPQRLRR
ncbi:hypothetical protein [Pseudomonas prosekii]|uniref:hypothetical protein n=1 Tax=Pseudomonas prosekii TaxID=1148509 RepID=UPI003F752F19